MKLENEPKIDIVKDDEERESRLEVIEDIVGYSIDNIDQLAAFIKAFNLAGIEVMAGGGRVTCGSTPEGELKVVLGPKTPQVSETWEQLGIKIECCYTEDCDGLEDYKYTIRSEAYGWFYQLTFRMPCVVTNVKWETVAYKYNAGENKLPSIVVCRPYIRITELLDKTRTRNVIMSALDKEYSSYVDSIGEVYYAYPDRIHVIDNIGVDNTEESRADLDKVYRECFETNRDEAATSCSERITN